MSGPPGGENSDSQHRKSVRKISSGVVEQNVIRLAKLLLVDVNGRMDHIVQNSSIAANFDPKVYSKSINIRETQSYERFLIRMQSLKPTFLSTRGSLTPKNQIS